MAFIFRRIRAFDKLPVSFRLVNIAACPESALIDEKVKIKVAQLQPNQEVTLHASLVDGAKRYSSFAYFTADPDGEVDVSLIPSQGGTYRGVDGEGLLWSLALEPDQRKGTRLIKKDVTTPYIVNINAYPGRHKWDDLCNNYKNKSLKTFAACQIQRWYMDITNVKRIPIREGHIRGTLFLPKGKRRFPSVIDLFGSGGGLTEHRAALLASHGYAVFALAFLQYEDLTKFFDDIDLAYFEEALDWMLRQPFKNDRGVGIVATSGGADIGLTMARYFKDKVQAAVLINPSCRAYGFPAKYKDEIFRSVFDEFQDFQNTPHGHENRTLDSTDFNSIPKNELHKIEEATAKILLLQSGDDRVILAMNHFQLVQRLKNNRDPGDFDAVLYPGAGHLLEPPYAPNTKTVYQKNINLNVNYGGVPHLHNQAQVDSWRRILSFLKRHLH